MLAIREYNYKSTCDVRRCSNRAELAVGIPDESPATDIILCKEHLEEIVRLGADEVGLVVLTDDIIKQLESKDAMINALEAKADELNNMLEAKGATIKDLEEKANELKKKLNAKPVAKTPATPAKKPPAKKS